MRISTRGRYGLRALVELARNFGSGPLLMSQIAEKQDFSRKYLHALLTSLKTAGIVRSARGSGGGYMLGREPSKITLSEVFKVLEGSLSLVDCVEDSKVCSRADSCETRNVWQGLSRKIDRHLSEISLADLAQYGGGDSTKALFELSLEKEESFERGEGI